MRTTSLSPALPGPAPAGLGLRRTVPIAAAVGIAWNLFGIAQWVSSLRADADSLMAGGLSRAQAELYLGLPTWMTVAFAVGVWGGLLGSGGLLLRRRGAQPLLALSLAAYALLFAGDLVFGLFGAMPGQLAVMSLVLLIAAGLLGVARRAQAGGLLR